MSNVEEQNKAITDEQETESEYESDGDSEESFEDEDDVEDEEEVNEDQGEDNCASLLAHNEAYSFMIEKMTKKVEQLLETNRDQQRKVKHIISQGLFGNRGASRVFKHIYNYPYFKDESGMVPERNEESRAIGAVCQVDLLMQESRPWSFEEIKLLEDAVISQLLEKKIEDTDRKRDMLQQKIRNYHAEDGITVLRAWRTELDAVVKRLNYLKSMSPEELLKDSIGSEFDWARIAAVDFKGTRTIVQLKMKWVNEQSPKWNKAPWTDEELEELTNFSQSPYTNWDYVAEKLNTDRSPFECFRKAKEIQLSIKEKKVWTAEEDEKLLSLMETYKFGDQVNWSRVAMQMPGRSTVACESRFSRSLDPGLKHGRWSNAEDLLLISAVNKYGPQDWNRIALQVPGRSYQQCRARWVDALDYKKVYAPWTVDEDELILVGSKIFGKNQYSKIAKLVPGRNTNDIKSRVRTLLKWKIVAILEETVPTKTISKIVPYENRMISKFKEIQATLSEAPSSGYDLAQRVGQGSYIVDKGETVDYSLIKKKITERFGGHIVGQKGNWVRRKNNPNEYGLKELEEEIVKLDEENKKYLTDFLRLKRARDQRFQNGTATEEDDQSVMQHVSELMADSLEVTEKDLNWYSSLKFNRRKEYLDRFAGRPIKKHKKKPNNVMDLDSLISDINLKKRFNLNDRMFDEFVQNINHLPKTEQRQFVISSMAELTLWKTEHETRMTLNKIPKELLQFRLNTYLFSNLMDSVTETVDREEQQPSTSKPFTEALKNPLPPTPSTINSLKMYFDHIRFRLIKQVNPFFPQVGNEEVDEHPLLNISLSKEITESREFKLLKQRIYRTFLFPMLMKKAFEARACIDVREQKRTILREAETDKMMEFSATGYSVKDGFYCREDDIDVRKLAAIPEANTSIIKEINGIIGEASVYNPLVNKPPYVYVEVEKRTRKRMRPDEIDGLSVKQYLEYTKNNDPQQTVQPLSDYRPRWAPAKIGSLAVGQLTLHQAAHMTVKDLLLLNKEQKEQLSNIVRSNPTIVCPLPKRRRRAEQ